MLRFAVPTCKAGTRLSVFRRPAPLASPGFPPSVTNALDAGTIHWIVASPAWPVASPFAGTTPVLSIRAPFGHGPKPSVARAFGGAKVRWTFALRRLTHRNSASVRFTLRNQEITSSSPSWGIGKGGAQLSERRTRVRSATAIPSITEEDIRIANPSIKYSMLWSLKSPTRLKRRALRRLFYDDVIVGVSAPAPLGQVNRVAHFHGRQRTH